MCNPALGAQLAVQHGSHDPVEILYGGIPATEQGHLSPMKICIAECHISLDDADENIAPPECDIFQPRFHPPSAAGRVEDDVEPVTERALGNQRLRIAFRDDG